MSDTKWRRPIPFNLPPAQTYDGKWHSMSPPYESWYGLEALAWAQEEHAGSGSGGSSGSVVAERLGAPSAFEGHPPSELIWDDDTEWNP